jgi:hypothetical protein
MVDGQTKNSKVTVIDSSFTQLSKIEIDFGHIKNLSQKEKERDDIFSIKEHSENGSKRLQTKYIFIFIDV